MTAWFGLAAKTSAIYSSFQARWGNQRNHWITSASKTFSRSWLKPRTTGYSSHCGQIVSVSCMLTRSPVSSDPSEGRSNRPMYLIYRSSNRPKATAAHQGLTAALVVRLPPPKHPQDEPRQPHRGPAHRRHRDHRDLRRPRLVLSEVEAPGRALRRAAKDHARYAPKRPLLSRRRRRAALRIPKEPTAGPRRRGTLPGEERYTSNPQR